ncbi:MAG TPA: hypothetical protein VIY10_22730 [Solirubrobacteraceae bacterium]|jgi:hypothetical protein
MTTSVINRRAAGAMIAALALGTAGPAVAHPADHSGPVQGAPPVKQVHYGKANVLPPYTGTPAVHYGKANVLPPFVPRHVKAFREATAAPLPRETPRAVVSHPHNGGSSDVPYIVVGGVLVALGGLGGTLAMAHRRRTAPARPRIAT